MQALLELQREGVVFNAKMVEAESLLPSIQVMKKSIASCAQELQVDTKLYLSSVSRWLAPSPITKPFSTLVHGELKHALEDLMAQPLTLIKTNVVCKNEYAAAAVPCHQDLAYQKETQPYDFSCWLALSEIGQLDGPLKCLPRSHLGPVDPAVDFWDVAFQDTIAASGHWQRRSTCDSFHVGDALLFDAATYHGSEANQTGQARYALVTRWLLQSSENKRTIPPKLPGKFGMWTCHDKTTEILQLLLRHYGINAMQDFINIVDRVITLLPALTWLKHPARAYHSLQRVRVLHLASKRHNAGDSQGNVYKSLWFNLLSEVKFYLQKWSVSHASP